MTKYLVGKFVKNSEDIDKVEVRTAYGILASIVGIICNMLLFAVKLTIGAVLNSISVMADAFNNLSDAASSVISFVGVKMASKPADENHPFGHGRLEYIAALVVSFIIMEVGFTFFKSAIGKIRYPEELEFQLVSVLILILSVAVKFWLSLFNGKLGRKINSKVMKATSMDALGDVIITTTTIGSILITRFTGLNIDGYVGLVVSLLVMYAGINIAKDTLMPLIGEAVDPQVYRDITEMVESYEGIVGSHDLIVHNYGPSHSMASIHAEVPNDVDIEVSHEIIDKIERDVMRQTGIFLVIHMDPVEVNDYSVLATRSIVEKVIENIDSRLTIHDFRYVHGEEKINLIFDVVVPYEYDKEKQDSLKEDICGRLFEIDPRYACIITMEKSYIAGQNSTGK